MNYFKFRHILKKLSIMLLFIQGAYSSLVLSGKVLDKKGNPLPGANVIIVNTNLGTASRIDGSYQLEVLDGAILNKTIKLKASYIGYESEIKNYIFCKFFFNLFFTVYYQYNFLKKF